MVPAVLDYYIQHCQPTYQDFRNDFSKSFGFNIPSFIDIAHANTRQYDFDKRNTLADGTEIVLKNSWKSGKGDETVVFMKEIDRLYRIGLLDKHVLYLG